jgi:hypothetical protein
MKLRIPLVAVLLLVLAGCGKDRDPTGPNQPGGAVNGTMTATIDGTPWSATIITPGITGGISAIGGSDGTRTMAFAWVEGGTGTYQVGSSVGFNANLTIAGGTWVANATGGTGTLVVTSRTANRIVGTFNFTMNASAGGATGTRNVTQGAFNITF